MLKCHRVSLIYWHGKFFDYPVSLKSLVHNLPEDNLGNFYNNRFGKTLYGTFFEGYTEKLWGRYPSVISADWGLQRVKASASWLSSNMRRISSLVGRRRMEKKDGEGGTSLIEEF